MRKKLFYRREIPHFVLFITLLLVQRTTIVKLPYCESRHCMIDSLSDDIDCNWYERETNYLEETFRRFRCIIDARNNHYCCSLNEI
ncbi:hypothetical protein NPIL_505621 [Nephila pilipes]|uniref:Uncharacterized protein n=1 Tax=Nephila pilipes TaxID=299642 RepID=A0A8X6PZ66_NEPPI|nr:hypothetical protein NPIL_505621 [Nephila pilipes]